MTGSGGIVRVIGSGGILLVTGSGGIMRVIGDQGDIMMDGLSDGMTHSTPGSLATLRNCTLGMSRGEIELVALCKNVGKLFFTIVLLKGLAS